MKEPVADGIKSSTLSGNSVLDLAVDSAKLLVHDLLGVVDKVVDVLLDVINGSTGLVATLGDNVGVVGRTTTVPGEKLYVVSI